MSALDEMRVVDESGADVAPGDEGELLVRGPYTLNGYYRAAERQRPIIQPGRLLPHRGPGPDLRRRRARPATWR